MKIWVSKWALTLGVFEVEAELKNYGYAKFTRPDGYYGYATKSQQHETKEQAVIKANKMREAKIDSLRKQIDKISKLTFE